MEQLDSHDPPDKERPTKEKRKLFSFFSATTKKTEIPRDLSPVSKDANENESRNFADWPSSKTRLHFGHPTSANSGKPRHMEPSSIRRNLSKEFSNNFGDEKEETQNNFFTENDGLQGACEGNAHENIRNDGERRGSHSGVLDGCGDEGIFS